MAICVKGFHKKKYIISAKENVYGSGGGGGGGAGVTVAGGVGRVGIRRWWKAMGQISMISILYRHTSIENK